LFSLVKFLRIAPFWDHYWWNRTLADPLRSSQPIGFERMQELLREISLRRVKDMKINGRPLLELTARNVYVKRIKYECMRESEREGER
jgi:SWI/SNF-related matrix-associated actin-dependent regulator of chromatin subfamily A3